MSLPDIGLIGRKRAGKDTVAGYLWDYGYRRIAFADRLKDLAVAVNPIIHCGGGIYRRLNEITDDIGWEAAKTIPDVRQFLQRLGKEGVRDCLGENTWVDAAMRVADEIDAPIAFTDVRFPNEVEAVLARGGRLLRIVRPGLDMSDTHESETALDGLRAEVLMNRGTLTDLQKRVAQFADSLIRIHHRSA